MRANQIRIDGVYRAKVSNKLVEVRIKAEHPTKGWLAENLSTGREIHVRTAARLREKTGMAGTVQWKPATICPHCGGAAHVAFCLKAEHCDVSGCACRIRKSS